MCLDFDEFSGAIAIVGAPFEAEFAKALVKPLAGPHLMVIGVK
jgi:hypothetical protein